MSDPWVCADCGGTLRIGDWPICKGDPSQHQPPGGHHHMVPYEVEIEGGRKLLIDSMQGAQRIERDRENAYREAKSREASGGMPVQAHETPLYFRGFHQDKSNMDRHVLNNPAPRHFQHTKTRLGRDARRGRVR